jgi:tRNA (mo5U34)-methyltransferase
VQDLNVRVADISTTTVEEQRSTDWMQFESLRDFLDADDAAKTIEGHPAPVRAVFIPTKR